MRTAASFILTGLLGLLLTNTAQAQTKNTVYTDASALKLVGRALPVKEGFHRVDTAAYPDLPRNVKVLLTHSAGLAISFTTNSTAISAKWCVTKAKQYANLTAIANKGLDLYIKKGGRWVFAGVGRPDSVCSQSVLVKNMEEGEKECLLYLPLYDELRHLEIGVDGGSYIKAGNDPFHNHILIYGSSILQGAAASRPGMAYPARLSRETGLNFMNLGLSGSAKMEKSAADLVASIPADAYILDCIPNSSPEQITERTAYLVNTIRAKHPHAPIIIVQSIIREGGNFDRSIHDRVQKQNDNILKQFQVLQEKGVKDLYFISADNLLGNDHEGTTDGTHPNDLGFDRMLQKLRPAIMNILEKYGIGGSSTAIKS